MIACSIAEPGLAFQFEDHRDRYAEPPLELAVGVVERLAQPFGEQPPSVDLPLPGMPTRKRLPRCRCIGAF
jgi:hypothetical protein